MKTEHFNGYISEQKAALYYAQLGYLIYWPNCTQSPCDFIACKEDEVLRIQVKSAYWSKNSKGLEYLISTVRKGCRQQNFYSKKDCDTVVIIYEDRVWVIPVEELNNESNITLDRKQDLVRSRCKDYSKFEIRYE